MSTVRTLDHAAALLGRFGYTPGDPTGSPLTGYSLAGAIEQAARDLYGELRRRDPARFAYLSVWVRSSRASVYVAGVLGYAPERMSPTELRRALTVDLWGAELATPWAVAVVRQAADLAASTSSTDRALVDALTAPTQPLRAVRAA